MLTPTVGKATRWDNYLYIFDPRIHWFSLINSVVVVVLLCVMVSMILVRSVSRDVCEGSPKHFLGINRIASF